MEILALAILAIFVFAVLFVVGVAIANLEERVTAPEPVAIEEEAK